MTLDELRGRKDWKTALIVYSQDNFNTDFSVKERTYRISRNNRFFQEGKVSNSLFGDCLDGKDLGVRLDWYNWSVESVEIEELE